MYAPRHLFQYLKIAPALAGLFAVLVGNDFMRPNELEQVYASVPIPGAQDQFTFARIINISRFLTKFANLSDALSYIR